MQSSAFRREAAASRLGGVRRLPSDFIHIAGMPIHIPLESTIHIAGIRTGVCLFLLARSKAAGRSQYI